MAYSGDISKLEACLSAINAVSLEVNFSSAWEGKAYQKQNELITNLNSSLKELLEQVTKLIEALSKIDEFHNKENIFNNYVNLLQGMNSDDSNYINYNNLKNTAYQEMNNCKDSAVNLLNGISDSYSSAINSIGATNVVSTSVSLLPNSLFSAGVTAVQSNDDSSKDWTDTVPAAVVVSSSVSHNSTNTGGVSLRVSSGGSTQPYVSVEAIPNYVVEKIDMSNVPDAPEDTICAANTNLNVKSKKKGITSTFSKQTQEIVTKHANDFNYENFKSIIGGDEDFKNYCKNVLGGVFAKWVGKKKKGEGTTASEFQEIAEYVFGLMVLYGFDYCNGDPGHYGKYGANNASVASNAFYPSGVYNSPGKNDNTNGGNIDAICAGTQKDGVNMTTNCNYGMDYLYRKAGILGENGAPKSSCAATALLKYASENGGGITTRVDQLQVGDLIQIYNGPVSEADAMSGDVSRWKKNGNWYHVCCVGEVEKNEAGETVAVVLYDAGHRFTNSGDFKYRVELDPNNTRNLGDYSNTWVGINLGVIEQDSYTQVS